MFEDANALSALIGDATAVVDMKYTKMLQRRRIGVHHFKAVFNSVFILLPPRGSPIQ